MIVFTTSTIVVFSAHIGSFANSLPGMQLADAKKEDFFVFFRLQETGRKPRSKDMTDVRFQPPAASNFWKLVTVVLTVDKDEHICDMQLTLKRSFIDDQKHGVFARDLAKSFLVATIPESDYHSARDLVNEIFFRQQQFSSMEFDGKLINAVTGKEISKARNILKGGTSDIKAGDVIIIGGTGAVPKLPDEPSHGYLVYAGKEKEFEQKLSKVHIRLKNENNDKGDDVLVISMSPEHET